MLLTLMIGFLAAAPPAKSPQTQQAQKAAAPASNSRTFDIICEAKEARTGQSSIFHFNIDLDANKWGEDNKDTNISLTVSDKYYRLMFNPTSGMSILIDRQTGTLDYELESARPAQYWAGPCKKEPFYTVIAPKF